MWDVLKEYPAARVRLEAIAVKRLEKYKKAPLEKGKRKKKLIFDVARNVFGFFPFKFLVALHQRLYSLQIFFIQNTKVFGLILIRNTKILF